MQKQAGGFHTPLQQLFLLEERFRLAGVRLPDEADQDRRLHCLKCTINATDCVIDMGAVAEVITDNKHVTSIPGAAAWIEGVMNYRGTLVPVYRPREFLVTGGGARPDGNAAGALLVLRQDRKGNEFTALRVDSVIGMQKFRAEEAQPHAPGAAAPGALAAYVDEVVAAEGRQWQRLDIQRLLGVLSGHNPLRQ